MGILLDSTRMEARLPFDKLIRAKQALQQWLHRKSATLKELQSLIGTLQFACRVVAPGRAFLQRIISLTKGITNSRWHKKLNGEFRKDISMWLNFLNHWNGVSLFLGGDVLSTPDLQLFTDASGYHGYGGYLSGEWFQATWLPQHLLNSTMGISIDWQKLFAITLPATSGALPGQANIFVCGATTCQLSPSSTPNALSPLGSWTSYELLQFLP